MFLVCIWEGWTIFYQLLSVYSIPGKDVQVRYTSSFSILVHPFYQVSVYQNKSCSFTVDVVFCWFHCGYMFWLYAIMVVWVFVKSQIFVGFIEKNLGAFLNMVTWLTILVLDLVLYLYVLCLSTLVPVFGMFILLESCGAVFLVYPLWLCQFTFLTFFLFLGATA